MNNLFLKGFVNFPSCDPHVNNVVKFVLVGLQSIRACQQYIVCRGYYLSICEKIICLKGVISYQGSLMRLYLPVEFVGGRDSRQQPFDNNYGENCSNVTSAGDGQKFNSVKLNAFVLECRKCEKDSFQCLRLLGLKI